MERGQTEAFDTLKQRLLEAPVLGMLDDTKSFHQFDDEHGGIAQGVLLRTLGPWKRLVAYLFRKLDPVGMSWSPCFCILVAMAVLVKNADKLTIGQNPTIAIPHALEGMVKHLSDR